MPNFFTAEVTETLPKAKLQPQPEMRTDVLVIGAGPTGLACAIEAQKLGLKVIVVDKGCLVNSLFHYPSGMVFFTTPELLEIGDIPFTTSLQKPTREEALEYYRKVAEHYRVDVRHYVWIKTVTGQDGNFAITATDRAGRIHDFRARKVIVATAYYDSDVLVIGGKNSAAIASLDLWRHRARVTLVHRESQMHSHVKYWIKPDIENRIKNGDIKAYFISTVQEIDVDYVVLNTPRGPVRLKND